MFSSLVVNKLSRKNSSAGIADTAPGPQSLVMAPSSSSAAAGLLGGTGGGGGTKIKDGGGVVVDGAAFIAAATSSAAGSINQGGGGVAVYLAIGYAISSSALSVVNKWALLAFPYPTTLTFLQYVGSASFAYAVGALGYAKVDKLEPKKAIAFMPAVLMFYVSIFTNTKLLQYATVDTFVVFRSCCPIIVLPLELLMLRDTTNTPGSAPRRRTYPSMLTVLSLVIIVIGAVGYGVADDNLQLRSYAWGFAYLATMAIDMVLVKKVVTEVHLEPWGLVLYNNALALLCVPLGVIMQYGDTKLGGGKEDDGSIRDHLASIEVASPVLLSCVLAVAISFFGMNARKALSATTFTVLGVANKVGTIVINTTVWNHHAPFVAIMWLIVCMGGAVLYSESVKQQNKRKHSNLNEEMEKEREYESKVMANGKSSGAV
uniref:Sugar phosphate transporter domain-containing protein n=1 Tax=Pycnococcus provasolii TaxID=41880 RepID=A0A7S2FHC9_9CHLO|mmetsp:Transcript_8333/g.18897  ORF Transcript_8333/g.18897 Transcript_8333/m.18897 type:complete len:430 (+) Transcript_8333:84-1373(+)